MTDSIYTDEMMEACGRACHEAHLVTGLASGLPPLRLPWGEIPPEWQEIRRANAMCALAGDEPCDLCISVSHAVARAMGWPRKP